MDFQHDILLSVRWPIYILVPQEVKAKAAVMFLRSLRVIRIAQGLEIKNVLEVGAVTQRVLRNIGTSRRRLFPDH